MKLASSRNSSYLLYHALKNPSVPARACALLAALICSCFLLTSASAQTTNPVDRKVENPITDTPYVNPLQQDQPVRPASASKLPPIQPGDTLSVDCRAQTFSGPKNALVTTCEGNVDARIGSYRLQADKVTVWLSPELVDLNQKLVVELNGRAITPRDRTVRPDLSVLLEDVRTRADRQHPFWAKVSNQ